LMMAAPVGVTVSPEMSTATVGSPSTSLATAGGGTGIVPWAH
jgi:hypothetical protein